MGQAEEGRDTGSAAWCVLSERQALMFLMGPHLPCRSPCPPTVPRWVPANPSLLFWATRLFAGFLGGFSLNPASYPSQGRQEA